MSGPVDLGDALALEYNVADASGVPVSCATTVLTVTKPDGTVDTVATTQSPTGTYTPTAPYVPTMAGPHNVRFVGTVPAVAITDLFDVQPASPALLFSLDDARAILGLPDADTSRDGLLRQYVAGLTTVVERICGRQVVTSITRAYDGGRAGILLPSNTSAVTSVVEAGVTLSPVNDYTYDPISCILYRGSPMAVFSFVQGIQNITVTFTSGNAIIPPNVLLGARLILRHSWQGTQQGYRPSFGAPDTSVETVNGLGYLIPHEAMTYLLSSPAQPGFA